MPISRLVGVMMLVAVSRLASAGVLYEFSGSGSIFAANLSFVYSTSTFITADTFVPASDLDSCTATIVSNSQVCSGVQFFPNGNSLDDGSIPPHPELVFFAGNNNSAIYYYFNYGADFGRQGIYDTISGNLGRLTISTPEPTTMTQFCVVFALALAVKISQRITGPA